MKFLFSILFSVKVILMYTQIQKCVFPPSSSLMEHALFPDFLTETILISVK